MKKIFTYLITFMVMCFMTTLAIAQNDPEGTIEISLRNEPNHPDNTFRIAGIDIPLQMTHGNNLQAERGNKWEFVSVGRRTGIAGIQKIPSEGWADKVRLEPQQAIVARFESKRYIDFGPVYVFVAIYVERWLTGAKDEGVIGAVIRYKADFEPTVQAISRRLFYDTYTVENESLAKWYLKYADSNNDGMISSTEANSVTVLGSEQDAIATFGPENIESFENLSCFRNLREIHINNLQETGLYSRGVQTAVVRHPTLEKIVYCDVEVPIIDLRDCPHLREIDLSYCKIGNVLLPPSIERVDLRRGKVTSIDVTECPQLTYLQVGGNQLTSLNLSGNPKLETLSVWDNQLTSLDVSKLQHLKKLYCANNKFATLDLSHNTGIEILSVADTKGSLKRVIIPKGKTKRDYKTESGALASFSGIEVVTEGQASVSTSQMTNGDPSQTGIYHVGDTIRIGRHLAIVFSVSEGGRHGKAVRIFPLKSIWHENYEIGSIYVGYNKASPEMLNMFRTGATSMTDGKANTDKIVRAARAIEAKTGEKYGKHIILLGLLDSSKTADGRYMSMYEQGWYIPAIDELEELYNAAAQDNLDEAYKKVGFGDFRISRFNGYCSSTEFYDPSYDKSFMKYYVMWMPTGQKLVYHKNDNHDFYKVFIHTF